MAKFLPPIFCIVWTLLNVFTEWASATGSITYLTNNGFPINFLESIVNSPIVQHKLKSRWKWEVWDVVPGTHAYQLYVFNITNPLEVQKGLKPILQQTGPYYYREKRVKFGVSINLDLTVNFERNYSYTFDPSNSAGNEDDLVNVLNIPLITFSSIASEIDAVKTNAAVNELISGGESLIRKGVRVGDLLYHGMDISKYEKYSNLLGTGEGNGADLISEFKSGTYGLLSLKNGLHEHAFVVDSGLKSQETVGKIVSWNSLTQLNWWNGDYCNAINASDASVFPPYLNAQSILKVFDLDLCRSTNFQYSSPMLFKDKVQGWTFNIADNTFEDPKVFQPNMCFCKTPDSCLGKGLIDVSKCKGGIPLVMSFAHFLNADPEYLQAVIGLNPDSALHQTQIDVEPVTGAVINYRKRYQWNIQLKPLPHIDYFRNIKPIIFPVIWNDDAFHLNPDKAELLVEELASQMGGGMDGSDLINKLYLNANNRANPRSLGIMELHLSLTALLSLAHFVVG